MRTDITYKKILAFLNRGGISLVSCLLSTAILEGYPKHSAIAAVNKLFQQKDINGDQHGKLLTLIRKEARK